MFPSICDEEDNNSKQAKMDTSATIGAINAKLHDDLNIGDPENPGKYNP